MTILVIIISTILFVCAGRWIFGRWYNHISLYAWIWGFSLSLFEMRLIRYYDLEPETWIFIVGGSLAFFLGSWTPVASRFATRPIASQASGTVLDPTLESFAFEGRLLNRILWVLNIIALLVALQHWYVVIGIFGSVENVLVLANLLYSFRVSEGLPGSIPYLSAVALTAAALGGAYTALAGKPKFAAILPLIIVLVIEVASMGRAKLIMAAVLFVTGFFLRRSTLSRHPHIAWRTDRVRTFFALALVGALLLGGIEFVRSTRGSIERLPAATRTLEGLRGGSFITPSVYLYLTVHHGVFNQYLKKDEERAPWGSNTFAPLYRGLSRLGFDTYVPHYQQFYRTPVGSNTGTYLRELHADFGLAGVFIVAYLIGFVTSFFWVRYRVKQNYVSLCVLSFMFVVIAITLFFIATRSGDLLVAFVVAVGIGAYIDHRRKVARASSEALLPRGEI